MDSSDPNEIATIAFYTGSWSELTNAIRRGDRPAGTASVFMIWAQCAKRGLDTHVFVIGEEAFDGPADTIELGGVRMHWIKPVAWKFRKAMNRLRLGPLVYWMKPLDWLRIWRTSRRKAPQARIHYSMRRAHAVLAVLAAKWTGGISVLRFYGPRLYHTWTEGSIGAKFASLPTVFAMKLPGDLFISTNDGTRADVAYDKLRVPKHKRHFWINGMRKYEMHLPDFDRAAAKQSRGLPADAPILMTVGRLTAYKRHDRVLRAMPRILAEFPDARYVLIGDGPERTKLEALGAELNIAHALVFQGAVPNEDLPQFLNFAEVFLLTSDITNLTTTLIEALAAGCCCVTIDVGTTSEVVKNGENALLLNPGEPDQIADTTLDLLRHPEKIEGFRRRAYEDAQSRFQSWDERLNMEIDLLLVTLNAKKRRPATTRRAVDARR